MTTHSHHPVLQRVRGELLQIESLLETGQWIESKRKIAVCCRNIERIKNNLGVSKYNSLKLSMEQLQTLCNRSERQQVRSPNNRQYCAERQGRDGCGRPSVVITRNQLLLFIREGFTATQIATAVACSKSVVYKRVYAEGIKFREKYSTISDAQLYNEIRLLSQQYPNSGSEIMCGLLKAKSLCVQRKRVRKILSDTNPAATAIRWSNSVQRRTYSVPTPNSLWHMDAHLKLSRWGFVTHSCIDGYSRLITYSKCTTSITAKTVLDIFVPSVKKYGLPSRIRSDHGYENLFVALLMNCIRGLNRGSHIPGRSIHNQRVERLWRDIHCQVISTFYTEFMALENQGKLDVEDRMHVFVLQFMYLDVINSKLEMFVEAWNRHRVRTMGRKTPRQLWISGMLSNMNSNHTATIEVFENTTYSLDERVEELFGDSLNEPIVEETEVSHLTAIFNISDASFASLSRIKEEALDTKEQYLRGIELLNSLN